MEPIFRLQGDTDGIAPGALEMAGHLGFSLSGDSGTPLIAIRTERPDVLELEMTLREVRIQFGAAHHFFRALSIVCERWRELSDDSGLIRVTERPQFDVNGAMFDCSRNAVMHVEAVKRVIRTMAAMGLNMLMLYTEDTYEIEGLPYFGYMRGRYTQAELREIDGYAALFGMEVIPCIQTLAHLTQALKWNYARDFKDTEDILLVGEPKTYEFIEKMIAAATAPFRSKRVHIGMDEAHRLGLGQSLERSGFRSRFELMNEHLDKVLEITRRSGLEPMIWSDMYFRLGSKHGWYYDLDVDIPERVIQGMPNDVRFVYWDYYHTDQSFYEAYIDIHRSFGSDPVFAGGVWTWNSFAPNYGKTIATTNAALAACKHKGIREVFATLWGNDGNETSYASAMLGLQWFAEHGYAEGVPDVERVNRRFAVCSGDDGAKGEDLLVLSLLDEVPGVAEGNLGECNPSKFLLWQDILLGLLDANVVQMQDAITEHYKKLTERLSEAKTGYYRPVFEFYSRLSAVLELKTGVGNRLKRAYDERAKATIERIAQEELPELLFRIESLHQAHRELWFLMNKPFGWEMLDMRYGALKARVESALYRLSGYLNGSVSRIEELEEKRLLFDWQSSITEEGTIGRCNDYQRIVTTGAVFS